MFGPASKGEIAGAAGTTALNTATHLDTAVRARGTSSMPERTVEELAGRAGRDIPGSGDERESRAATLRAMD